MPAAPRQQLIASVMDELRAYIDAVDAFETALARRYGVERSDLRWLTTLAGADALTAAELARASGVPEETVAAGLSRLEQGGHLSRTPGDGERVSMTSGARGSLAKALGPVDAAKWGLHRYGAEELGIVRNFLRVGRHFYESQLRRIGQRRPSPPPI
jgi:DNA-binding MarR family transcriptional regulator